MNQNRKETEEYQTGPTLVKTICGLPSPFDPVGGVVQGIDSYHVDQDNAARDEHASAPGGSSVCGKYHWSILRCQARLSTICRLQVETHQTKCGPAFWFEGSAQQECGRESVLSAPVKLSG